MSWDTSYTGDEPIAHYEIVCDGKVIGTVGHLPQTSGDPFIYEVQSGKEYQDVAVGRKSAAGVLI